MEMVNSQAHEWLSANGWKLGLSLVILLFLLMVVSLLVFHTYLAFANMTTWENLSWEKISYLKEWRTEWGSPFSQGMLKNVKNFCCTCRTELARWKMPKFKKAPEHITI